MPEATQTNETMTFGQLAELYLEAAREQMPPLKDYFTADDHATPPDE